MKDKEVIAHKSNEVDLWSGIRTIIIHLTKNCNMDCKYCFESPMRGVMSEKDLYRIIDRSIDSVYFQDIKANQKGSVPKLNISFFGGEPLVEYELMKKGVAYAIKNKSDKLILSFGITTNGVLLTKDKVDFMVKHNFSMILSIDGDKETHDENRVYKNGEGTYEDIMKHIPYLLKTMVGPNGRTRVTVRPSYTNESGEKLFNTIKHLRSLGFTSLAPIPVIDSTKLGKRMDWESSWRKIEEQHWTIAEWWYDMNFKKGLYVDVKFIRDFGRDFLGRYQPTQNLACGTGMAYQAYGPDGYVYPCHRWVNDVDYKKFRMATVDSENISRKDAEKFWISRKDFVSEIGCQQCPLEDLCTKGCNVVNYKTTGDRKMVPKEHCWFEFLRHKIGMRLLSKYGNDIRMINMLSGKIGRIASLSKPIAESHVSHAGQTVIDIPDPTKDQCSKCGMLVEKGTLHSKEYIKKVIPWVSDKFYELYKVKPPICDNCLKMFRHHIS